MSDLLLDSDDKVVKQKKSLFEINTRLRLHWGPQSSLPLEWFSCVLYVDIPCESLMKELLTLIKNVLKITGSPKSLL